MPLAPDAICRQPRQLRKALKNFRKDSSPEAVHKLRTRARRIEAVIAALGLDTHMNERKLIDALKPLRRRAGQVRDMDVLTELASRPHLHGEEECSIQLLEHLGAERQRQAAKLKRQTRAEYPEIQRRLRDCATLLDKTLQPKSRASAKARSRSLKWAEQATARALQLEDELRNWPALNRKNLHPFRLKVKKLRYVLQTARSNENGFVASLGEVKDSIGEWHDWQQLSSLANELFEHAGCKLRQQIRRSTQERLESALSVANRLRNKYLETNRQADHPEPSRLNPAIAAAAALAA